MLSDTFDIFHESGVNPYSHRRFVSVCPSTYLRRWTLWEASAYLGSGGLKHPNVCLQHLEHRVHRQVHLPPRARVPSDL